MMSGVTFGSNGPPAPGCAIDRVVVSCCIRRSGAARFPSPGGAQYGLYVAHLGGPTKTAVDLGRIGNQPGWITRSPRPHRNLDLLARQSAGALDDFKDTDPAARAEIERIKASLLEFAQCQ